jgi:hypothetical protein
MGIGVRSVQMKLCARDAYRLRFLPVRLGVGFGLPRSAKWAYCFHLLKVSGKWATRLQLCTPLDLGGIAQGCKRRMPTRDQFP